MFYCQGSEVTSLETLYLKPFLKQDGSNGPLRCRFFPSSLKYTKLDIVTPTHPGSGPQTIPGVANSTGLERQFGSDPFPLSGHAGGPEDVVMPNKT